MTKKVIVADDKASLRSAYVTSIQLAVSDVEVEEVSNGEELVERVRNGGYSLVITDNEMGPGIDGLEAIRRIREFDTDVPIYMASASDAKDLALQLGATGYIDKREPTKSIETFKTAIMQYLK